MLVKKLFNLKCLIKGEGDIMEEINLDDRRSFIGPDEETEYFIGALRADDIRAADWHYSKTYTNCLNEGITTSAEMMDILRRRGIIGEDFDKRAAELSTILNDSILKLNDAVTNDEKAELAVEVAKNREALFQWNQRLSGPMGNTCEQIADDARLEYLTSVIIQHKDGSKVWDTFEDFLANKDQALTMKARYEVMLFLQGYEPDFLEKTPEAIAMREVEADLIRQASIVNDESKTKETKIEKKTSDNIVNKSKTVKDDTVKSISKKRVNKGK